MNLTDLILRDPRHPEVRAELLRRYEQVCMERQQLARLLGLPVETRAERRATPSHSLDARATLDATK